MNYPAGRTPGRGDAADFNNDGRLDLAVANADGNTVSVLLGNADGTFQPAQTPPPAPCPRSLAVGDFNADGKLDLATANDQADVSVLLGNGDGTFQAPTSIGSAGHVRGRGRLQRRRQARPRRHVYAGDWVTTTAAAL